MSVEKSGFGEYTLYTIKNAAGASVGVTDLGAAVQSIVVPDRNGVLGDVVLGYDTPQEYLDNDGYFGAAVGRYANRIAGAQFTLNGNAYKLTANEGANTLHGGVGFSKRRFDLTAVTENSVRFELTDPDGGDGFPGNITVSVEYEFTDDNRLVISYTARSDKDTVLNLTNHSYFNLAGRGDILSHELMINADSYLLLIIVNLVVRHRERRCHCSVNIFLIPRLTVSIMLKCTIAWQRQSLRKNFCGSSVLRTSSKDPGMNEPALE